MLDGLVLDEFFGWYEFYCEQVWDQGDSKKLAGSVDDEIAHARALLG